MTDKRFINDIDIGQLIDTKGELSTIDYSDKVDFYELWEFLNKLNEENEELKAILYAEKTNTAEVINDYSKQFKRHSKEFSFIIDLAEDLGVDVSKLEAKDD